MKESHETKSNFWVTFGLLAVLAIIPALFIGLAIPGLITAAQSLFGGANVENFFWDSSSATWLRLLAYPIAWWLIVLVAYRPQAESTTPAGLIGYAALVILPLTLGGALVLLNPMHIEKQDTDVFKDTEFYGLAIHAAQADPTIVKTFGTPIERNGNTKGSITTQGLSGNADIIIPISGPLASGNLFASARRENGIWRFFTFAFQTSGSNTATTLKLPSP